MNQVPFSLLSEDGRIFTGVLAAETATSITLGKEEGVQQTILRREIDEMEASSLSMMPEELEKQVTPQEVADLIAYLREALGPLPPSQLVLFDDEPEFAGQLHEGKGTATLETADRHAGDASLKITPPQRFSASIPGWSYRIAENPAPGEYRYLRFAWKSRGAGGVMEWWNREGLDIPSLQYSNTPVPHSFLQEVPMRRLPLIAVVLVAALATYNAALAADEEGFRPLLNGKDLSGWVNVNLHDDTMSVRDGVIYCTGKPAGVMRTDRQYENFILELEWRHLRPGGNAGLFVWSDAKPTTHPRFTRSIEVQILDGRETANYTSHGDVFSIHGAKMTPDRPHPAGWMRCLPSEKRCNPSPEWNHYRVTCNDGVIQLAVNGKVVSGGHDVTPRKGYICLESEGSPVEFRNIRIKELPSTGATPEETATLAEPGEEK